MSGSFAQLADILGELSTVPSRAAAEASGEINELIHQQFVQGADPYGRPWAPLAPATLAKGRAPPPLFDSGDMASETGARPAQGAGIELNVPAPGGFHQFGSRNVPWNTRNPARPILPDGDELPEAWQAAIEKAVDNATARVMGGR